MKRRAILAFMHDRPGVLNKVSMLIRKKMYNVDTLTVCSSRVEGISRMTITLREDDIAKVTQVIKQLEKFTEVISAKELDTQKSFWREAAIVKIEVDLDHRADAALDAAEDDHDDRQRRQALARPDCGAAFSRHPRCRQESRDRGSAGK